MHPTDKQRNEFIGELMCYVISTVTTIINNNKIELLEIANLLEKNEEYGAFTNKDKMLTFFFTFFELLTLNRSYVLFVLDGHENMMSKMKELKGLRKHMKDFATDLIEEANAEKSLKLTKRNPQIFSEGAWIQLLFLLKFWMDDTSAGFEKTDMAIEKSVTTIFDVFENTPLDSILDFGKFLYKENLA